MKVKLLTACGCSQIIDWVSHNPKVMQQSIIVNLQVPVPAIPEFDLLPVHVLRDYRREFQYVYNDHVDRQVIPVYKEIVR